MSNEQKILAACIKDRKAYERIKDNYEAGDFTAQGNVIWKHLSAYYVADPNAPCVDAEILGNSVLRNLQNPKHHDTFERLLKDIVELEVSPTNVVRDFIGLRKQRLGAEIAQLLLRGDSASGRLEEYIRYEELEDFEEADKPEVYNGVGLVSLSENEYSDEALIRIWPTSLNERLGGGLLRGHHVVVFARPEVGKTMFLINAIAGFLFQGLKVLYCGNEDPLPDIMSRVQMRLAEMISVDAWKNPAEAERLAREKGYENAFFADLSPGTPKQISELIEDIEPDVVLIDQLRNIRTGASSKDGNLTPALEQAAIAARNLAKKHKVLMISVTQAGVSAENRIYGGMDDIDSSKTGVPAQGDVILYIGMNENYEKAGLRGMSLCKNKRTGIHDDWDVRVIPQMSKITRLHEQGNTYD